MVEVTRLSADCQTTIFGRFKTFFKFFSNCLKRLKNVVWLSADGRVTSDHCHVTVQRLFSKISQIAWNVEKTLFPSADCRTTFFRRFKQLENFLIKVAERSRDSGRRSRDRRPTVKQRFWTFQAIRKFFDKSRWTVTRQWLRSRDRRPAVKQRFLDVSSNLGKFWKKSLNGHARVVGGHATIGRLSNNVFSTFQAIWEIFEKSRWTVTWQWSEVTRPSADSQTTFFRRFKQLEKNLKKVAERSRDNGRRSRDRRLTVKQRFLDVSSNLGNFEKSRWTVTRQWSEVTRPSADCQTTFFGRFKQFGKILKKVAERSRDSGWRSRDHRPTVKQRFLDVSSN